MCLILLVLVLWIAFCWSTDVGYILWFPYTTILAFFWFLVLWKHTSSSQRKAGTLSSRSLTPICLKLQRYYDYDFGNLNCFFSSCIAFSCMSRVAFDADVVFILSHFLSLLCLFYLLRCLNLVIEISWVVISSVRRVLIGVWMYLEIYTLRILCLISFWNGMMFGVVDHFMNWRKVNTGFIVEPSCMIQLLIDGAWFAYQTILLLCSNSQFPFLGYVSIWTLC